MYCFEQLRAHGNLMNYLSVILGWWPIVDELAAHVICRSCAACTENGLLSQNDWPSDTHQRLMW